MKHLKRLSITKNIFFVIIPLILFTSCSKKTDTLNNGTEAKLRINFSVNVNSENIGNKASVNNGKASSAIQYGSIPYSNGNTIAYELSSGSSSNTNKLQTASNNISNANKAAVIQEKKELTLGIVYRILAYNSDGDLKGDQTNTYDGTNNTTGMALNAGESYTFIIYSINSEGTLPTVTNEQKLATAVLQNVTGDLMYFKNTQLLTFGDNYLNAVLKHKFSSITTVMEVDENTVGTFTALSNPNFKPSYTNATLKFENDAISYINTSTAGASIFFPNLGMNGLTSVTSTKPTIIISPSTTEGMLTIDSVNIDGEYKKGFQIPNIKIEPGLHYNLKLIFKTCTQNVGDVQGLKWTYLASTGGSAIVKNIRRNKGYEIFEEITAPAADYGFVFDITQLDNTFNMTHLLFQPNGDTVFTKLANEEIQFQYYPGSLPANTIQQNIRFKDGSRYAFGDIPNIYTMTGTPTKPLLRIIISKNGTVRMLGSKTSEGDLYELELFNNNFNTFTWNTNLINKIRVTQKIDGLTILIGNGVGKKKISCNP